MKYRWYTRSDVSLGSETGTAPGFSLIQFLGKWEGLKTRKGRMQIEDRFAESYKVDGGFNQRYTA